MRAAFLLPLVSLAVALASQAGCGGSSSSGGGGSSSASSGKAASSSATGSGGGGGAGGAAPVIFSPDGCGFSIASRAEYQGFQPSAPTVGATPNIRRVRLGLGGSVALGAAGHADASTTIAMAWQTDDGTLASEVEWGPGSDPTAWPAANRKSGVTWVTPSGMLGDLPPERMHEVYVCGLAPATTYYYRVGGGPAGKEVWSDVVSFTTTPAPGPTAVKIAITGDSRGEGNDAWHLLQRQVALLGANLQLFSGDVILLAQDQTEWEKWLDKAWKDDDGTPLTLSQLLTLSTNGNHDQHTALYFGNLVMPQDPQTFPKYDELFYSVDVGPVHVVVVDDAWVIDPSGDIFYADTLSKWLDDDLGAAVKNRANVPWIVAMHHHSEFSSSTHGNDAEVLQGRQFFVPIWDKYHVDLVVGGHDHDYERSKPVTGPYDHPVVQATAATGTTYLVCAGAGADGYAAGSSDFTAASHDYTSGGAIGAYAVLDADATSLKLEAHELRADATNPVIDTVTITK